MNAFYIPSRYFSINANTQGTVKREGTKLTFYKFAGNSWEHMRTQNCATVREAKSIMGALPVKSR